jgi:hypothetical protein
MGQPFEVFDKTGPEMFIQFRHFPVSMPLDQAWRF